MANKFIGSGIIFPITLNASGRPDFVNDVRLLNSSIKNILYWPKNHRFFNENFGSRIEELIEEPNDGVSFSLLRTFIAEALADYEKRIIVKSVSIQSYDYTKVNVKVTYSIRTTKLEETLIFPYYKNLQ